MLLEELTQGITTLRGVGPAMAARLERLGIASLGDLLALLPRGYEDRRAVTPLAGAVGSEKAAVDVTVQAVGQVGKWRARTVKALVADASAEASLVCFGRAFLRGRGAEVTNRGRRIAPTRLTKPSTNWD